MSNQAVDPLRRPMPQTHLAHAAQVPSRPMPQAPSPKLTHANPSCLLFYLTHLSLSDPAWPLFSSVWPTKAEACLLIRWVVSVFFHHVMLVIFDLGNWNDKFFMSVGNFLFARNLYLLIVIINLQRIGMYREFSICREFMFLFLIYWCKC